MLEFTQALGFFIIGLIILILSLTIGFFSIVGIVIGCIKLLEINEKINQIFFYGIPFILGIGTATIMIYDNCKVIPSIIVGILILIVSAFFFGLKDL